ncbi:FxSxx-COOH cyclophane-containing RiPP peptide [Streptomyces sp.]|uniref:FxSxx-COOH cyclophane-containing RiPP peptide n=1 Tax=Streptomyces sp. TaxID=1931 RepID=UPI002F420FB4
MEHRPHDGTEPAQAGIDLLGMDLEDLRTVDHPVLAALVDDLRRRVAAPGSEAMWGFDNDTDEAGVQR